VEKPCRLERRLPGSYDANLFPRKLVVAPVFCGVRNQLARKSREQLRHPLKVPKAHRHHHPPRLHPLAARQGDRETIPGAFDPLDIDALDLRDESLLQPQPILVKRVRGAGLATLEAPLAAPVVERQIFGTVDGSREAERLQEDSGRHLLPKSHRLAEDSKRHLAVAKMSGNGKTVWTCSSDDNFQGLPSSGTQDRTSAHTITCDWVAPQLDVAPAPRAANSTPFR